MVSKYNMQAIKLSPDAADQIRGQLHPTPNHNSRPPANADPNGCRFHLLVV